MKKFISILMVLAMLATLLTVGITTTSAADTATVTIYGLDGTTEVREFDVGDTFTVYTTLDVSSSVPDGKIGSVQGTQTYTSDVLSLFDEISGQYGEFVDPVKVFPITGEVTVANGAQAGKIVYNASKLSSDSAFIFDSPSSQLIVTTYYVKSAGNAEIKNAIRNLAAADTSITRIVFEGQVQEGKSIAGKASFTDPTPQIDHAEVRIHSLDGRVETQSFNIGDTFTAYTVLNASSVNNGLMGSVNGVQRYTSSVLELTNAVDADGYIENVSTVFPVMKDSAIANAKNAGIIKFAGSSTAGFPFNSNDALLIVTTYRVKANGYADISNKMNVLAAADEDITRIVFNGKTQSGKSYAMPASFNSDVPVPTEPERPTQPPTTPPETQPVSTKLKVTIVNPDNTTVVKEFNKNDTFTVYTVLNAGATIASVEGTQTYSAASLQLTDSVTGEYNEIVNKTAMFPILGDEVVAAVQNGNIKFNASRGAVAGGYAFNTASSKLIVTNYKVLAAGEATIKTTLRTLIKDDANATKIVFGGAAQSGQSYAMPGSFTDPANPDVPTEPEPTQPEPTVPANKAVVTIYGIDGSSKTKTFNIGDTFTVYTTFDASKNGIHGIASISATQTFNTDILSATDEIDAQNVVVNPAAMFPILGGGTIGSIIDGVISYNASTPQIGKGFVFDSPTSMLIISHYQVMAAGAAEIRNNLKTVAGDDSNLTKLVMKGVVQPGKVVEGIASFTDPTQPEPTEPEPTEPEPTQPEPTEPENKAIVRIHGIDGTINVKTFSVGDEFTVYTTFDMSNNAPNGVASLSATQTFTNSVLQSTDELEDGYVKNTSAMFPVMKDGAMARVEDGMITYNASTPNINNGYMFNSDTESLLIVTNYKVIAAGIANIKNSLITVASADGDLTHLIKDGVLQPGVTVGGKATFTDPTNPEQPTQPTVRYLVGDADNNGKVASKDVTILQRYLIRMNVNVDTDIMIRNCDLNKDGKITSPEVTFIQRKLVRMEVPYPIDEWVEE